MKKGSDRLVSVGAGIENYMISFSSRALRGKVVGKAIFTIPYVGYIGYFVRTPIGFMLLIIIPASLIIIIEIRNIIKELKKNQKSKTNWLPSIS